MKPKLGYGSLGPYVAEVQQKLNALLQTASPLKIDGKYFDKTVARVKQFQKSRGLVPDGVVGAHTWAAFDGAAPPVGSTPPSKPKPPGKPLDPSPHHKDVKVYVGATMQCSFGTQPSSIRLTPGQPATMSDCKAWVNIGSFHRCRAPQRVGMNEHFVDPVLGASFDTGMPENPCTPIIVTPWAGSFDKGGDDMSQTIDKTAHCLCFWAGNITFK
jgi:hypothetical protein